MAETSLMVLLRNGLAKVMELQEKKRGEMTHSRFAVLDFLAKQTESTKQLTIVTATGIDRSTMSAMVKSMRKDGLVLVEPDPDDRRATIVTLTTTGRKLYRELSKRLRASDRMIEKETPALRGELETLIQL